MTKSEGILHRIIFLETCLLNIMLGFFYLLILIHTIAYILFQISPVQKKRVRSTGEEISFKRALLRDDVGEIPVCLWRDLAENNVQKGDCIKVTNFSVSETFGENKTSIPAICNKFETSSVEVYISFVQF